MDRPFVKIIPPGSYDFGEQVVQHVKIARDGRFHGNDLRDFIKRAGYQFAHKIRDLDLKAGDVPVHILAIGSTEYFGVNRNADGFREKICMACHPTFVKYARLYRNHQNKDPEKSYGYIKESAYNDRMHRIELLGIYNGTKEAARRNGGLVADEEMNSIESGLDMPGSMACRVPYDVCTSCGNKARNRKEYCRGNDEGGSCPDGGLFSKIGAVVANDESPILGADNIDPLFFDYSKVARGADRTSFILSNHIKAANAAIIGGAALAEHWGITAPAYLDETGDAADMYKIACRLAAIESGLGPQDRWLLAFQNQTKTAWHNHGALMGEALQALAMAKIAMPIEGFVQLVNDEVQSEQIAERVRNYLPGIFGRLVKSGEIHKLIESNPFLPANKLPPLSVRKWAAARAAQWSVDPQAAEKRLMRNALYQERPVLVKKAAAAQDGPAEELAKHYASYQLAFLTSIKDSSDYDLTAKLCVVQNHT